MQGFSWRGLDPWRRGVVELWTGEVGCVVESSGVGCPVSPRSSRSGRVVFGSSLFLSSQMREERLTMLKTRESRFVVAFLGKNDLLTAVGPLRRGEVAQRMGWNAQLNVVPPFPSLSTPRSFASLFLFPNQPCLVLRSCQPIFLLLASQSYPQWHTSHPRERP